MKDSEGYLDAMGMAQTAQANLIQICCFPLSNLCRQLLLLKLVLDTVWKTKVLANKCSKAKIKEPLEAVLDQ